MSYSLYLKPRRSFMAKRRALAYLRQRKHYEVDAKHGQALYENDDTGVHFQFEFNEDSPDSPANGYPYLFQVNFWRPSHFILEAALEVADFVERFDCTVLEDGVTEAGPYSADGFIERWNHGNEFAYRAILSKSPEEREGLLTLPTAQLHRIWRWNYTVEAKREAQVTDTFVPKILVVLVDGILSTIVVWPDAISSVLPKVDYLLVGRERFLPPGLTKTEGQVLLPWHEATGILDRYGTPSPEETIALRYIDQPDDVADFVRSLTPGTQEINGAGMVLDREIVERALAGL
jgi:hypothetical protein